MWEEEQEKRGMKIAGLESSEQSWQINTDAPSDLLVRVGDVDFHVHKFPLLSRCGKLNRLYHDRPHESLLLPDFPGGPSAFLLAAKFCYSLPVDLSASSIAALRCAAEFLDMSEDLHPGNLILKTESFLSYLVLSSWRDSIIVLRSCETLAPWAENLQIVRRCSESIAWKTFSESIDSWIEDLATLRIDHFVRVISAMKSKGIRADLLGSAVVFFAERWIESEEGMRIAGSGSGEKRTVAESLISVIPQERDCVSCGFLMRMVRIGGMLEISQALMADLEKRAGMQLEQAEVADLLIPAYGGAAEMYDVDLVRRLVEEFLVHEQDEEAGAMARVARLVDSYLTEVARDRNLSTSKFLALAEVLPETARISDDGLYRAVDSYLKAHPATTEHERKRLCRVMDCQKLSMDACMHAAQNERLPLRTALHVLFSEQLKLSAAISGGDVLPRRMLSPPEDLATTKKEISALKFELDAMKVKYLELQANLEGLQRQLDKGLARQHKSPAPSSGWAVGWKKLSRLSKKGMDERVAAAAPVEVATTLPGRKGQRRWRNSIS